MRSILLALSLWLIVPNAVHAQVKVRTEADCEKLEEALAYNACLAELGPRVGERRPVVTGAPSASRNPVLRRQGGRKAATFDVITGNK